MISFQPTPMNAGLILWGDRWTLTQINSFVHRVAANNPVIPDDESFVLGLAYDARKAAAGMRLVRDAAINQAAGSDTAYGVEILWPVLVAQLGLLRRAMAHMPLSRDDQSIMFGLEGALEFALQASLPEKSSAIMAELAAIGEYAHSHLNAVLDSRCRYFIEQKPSRRMEMLPAVLASLNPMYCEVLEQGGETAAGMIPGSIWAAYETDDELDWPDFEW